MKLKHFAVGNQVKIIFNMFYRNQVQINWLVLTSMILVEFNTLLISYTPSTPSVITYKIIHAVRILVV